MRIGHMSLTDLIILPGICILLIQSILLMCAIVITMWMHGWDITLIPPVLLL